MFTVSEQIEYDRDGIKIVDGYRVDKDGRPVAFDLTALDARILCEGCAAHQDLGKTPAEIAASLADAQAEIARLRGALEACQRYALEFPDSLLRDNLLDTAADALK